MCVCVCPTWMRTYDSMRHTRWVPWHVKLDAFWCAAVPVKLHYAIVEWTTSRRVRTLSYHRCGSHSGRGRKENVREANSMELRNKVGGWFAKFRYSHYLIIRFMQGDTRQAPESNDHTLMQYCQKWPDRISMARRMRALPALLSTKCDYHYQKQMFGM